VGRVKRKGGKEETKIRKAEEGIGILGNLRTGAGVIGLSETEGVTLNVRGHFKQRKVD